ncbi:MAG: hypothetical protein GY863_23035 [bacterium]|nr:hypothetical protein [bacterium]
MQFGCAVQSPPSGGPVDATPPEILEVFPGTGDLNVPLQTEISITFSERMDRAAVEKAFFISPQPESYPEFDWKGRSLKIKYDEELKSGRTYSINIGTAAADLHRVALNESYSWAFSTGNTIDKGFISGKVYTFEDKVKGLVWAYLLEGEELPDPFTRKGDFITQTDDEGNFVLSYLAEGNYRVFAINDKNEDLNFSMFTDPVGMPSAEVTVTMEDTVSGLLFQTSIIDTLPPAPVSIYPADENHITVRFNEPLEKSSVITGVAAVYEMSVENRIPDSLITVYQPLDDNNTIIIYTSALTALRDYQVSISGYRDEHYNEITELRDSTTVFTASSSEDTVKPNLVSISPADSAVDIPVYSVVELRFDHPVKFDELAGNFSLVDSSKSSVPFRAVLRSPTEIAFTPENHLLSMVQYTIGITEDNIHGINDQPLLIQQSEYQFTAMSTRQTGNLSGSLQIKGDAGTASMIVELAANDSEEDKRTVLMGSPGSFEFSSIPRGEYTLSAFLDVNGDGKWTKGRIKPFIPAEPFVIFKDVLTIRPGVDNVGNDLLIIIQ